jgi:hypothetical protein
MENWVNMCVTKNWREMGAWGMKISDGSWIVIDVTDRQLFKDALLGAPEGPRYFARVRRIVLDAIPKKKLAKAVKTCGFYWDKEGIVRVNPLEEYIPGVKFIGNKVSPEYEETVIVDSCVQYGLGDFLWEQELDDPDRLRELAKKEAYQLIRNTDSLPNPKEVAEFNELLKKHQKQPMFPLSNILPSSKPKEKQKILN